jgi:hypothetical protein
VQLRDRSGRDVQPNQVESSIEERNKVAAVAAADIATSPQPVLAGGGHDVVDEADGRLVSEMPGRVRSIPRRCGVVIHNYEPKVPLRQRLLLSGRPYLADGSRSIVELLVAIAV